MPYKAANLRVVLEETLRAVEQPDGRIAVPTDRRKVMRAIATPLELGTQHEEPFVLGTRWKDHFDRAIAAAQQEGQAQITVGDLRRWTDQPEPLGLPRDLQSLVILVYAAQSGRVFRQHGGPVEPSLDKLDDDFELVSPQLPSEEAWKVARARAAVGARNRRRQPGAQQLRDARREPPRGRLRRSCPRPRRCVPVLERRIGELGGDPDASARAADRADRARARPGTRAKRESDQRSSSGFAGWRCRASSTSARRSRRPARFAPRSRVSAGSCLVSRSGARTRRTPGFVEVVAALRDAVCGGRVRASSSSRRSRRRTATR